MLVIQLKNTRDSNVIFVNGKYEFIFDFSGNFRYTGVKNPTPDESKMYDRYFNDGKAGDAKTTHFSTIITDVKGYLEKDEKEAEE